MLSHAGRVPKDPLFSRRRQTKDLVAEEIQEPIRTERLWEPADLPLLLGVDHRGPAVRALERLVAAQIDRAERKISATFDPVLEYAEFAKRARAHVLELLPDDIVPLHEFA